MVDLSFDCAVSIEEICEQIVDLADGWEASNGVKFRVIGPHFERPSRARFWLVDEREPPIRLLGEKGAFDPPGEIEVFPIPNGVKRLDFRGGGEAFAEFAKLVIREVQVRSETSRDDAGEQPWKRIPDVSYYRHLVELWWDGWSSSEIGERLGYSQKTILNRLSDLRRIYGEEIVPKRRKG